MSFAEIQAEVDRLTPEEQKRLNAYIVAKNWPISDEEMQELSRKIDDKDPSHWVTLEELGKRLGIADESSSS